MAGPASAALCPMNHCGPVSVLRLDNRPRMPPYATARSLPERCREARPPGRRRGARGPWTPAVPEISVSAAEDGKMSVGRSGAPTRIAAVVDSSGHNRTGARDDVRWRRARQLRAARPARAHDLIDRIARRPPRGPPSAAGAPGGMSPGPRRPGWGDPKRQPAPPSVPSSARALTSCRDPGIGHVLRAARGRPRTRGEAPAPPPAPDALPPADRRRRAPEPRRARLPPGPRRLARSRRQRTVGPRRRDAPQSHRGGAHPPAERPQLALRARGSRIAHLAALGAMEHLQGAPRRRDPRRRRARRYGRAVRVRRRRDRRPPSRRRA